MLDFRSDTVTQPTAAMRQAMHDALLGDDVFADDPTVNQLQDFAADLLGFEAALFAPSGTMTNLMALMSHCQRGDEAIVGQNWHTYRWEGGGMAVLGSIQPQPIANQADGSLLASDIIAAIKPDDPHFARTKLLVIENTTGGKVLPLSYMQQMADLAKTRGLSSHIDGARLMNAAVALGGDPYHNAQQLCAGFDSVSLCLSKGLGAPVGSLLLGNSDFILRAKRIRKMLGGGMRQAGVLAAAGLYALEHHVHRLAEDHVLASQISAGLQQLSEELGLTAAFKVHTAHTNMLFLDITPTLAALVLPALNKVGIRLTSSQYLSQDQAWQRVRLVTHLDLPKDALNLTLAGFRQAFTLQKGFV